MKPSTPCYYANSQDIGRKIITNSSTPGAFRSLTNLSSIFPFLNDEALRNYRGSSRSSLIGEKSLQIGDEFISATLKVPNSTTVKQPLPQITKTVQIEGLSHEILFLNLFHFVRPFVRYIPFPPQLLCTYPFVGSPPCLFLAEQLGGLL